VCKITQDVLQKVGILSMLDKILDSIKSDSVLHCAMSTPEIRARISPHMDDSATIVVWLKEKNEIFNTPSALETCALFVMSVLDEPRWLEKVAIRITLIDEDGEVVSSHSRPLTPVGDKPDGYYESDPIPDKPNFDVEDMLRDHVARHVMAELGCDTDFVLDHYVEVLQEEFWKKPVSQDKEPV